MKMLRFINRKAFELSEQDKGKPDARHRINLGAYFLRTPHTRRKTNDKYFPHGKPPLHSSVAFSGALNHIRGCSGKGNRRRKRHRRHRHKICGGRRREGKGIGAPESTLLAPSAFTGASRHSAVFS